MNRSGCTDNKGRGVDGSPPLSIHRHTHTEANIMGWQVFRGLCYSKGVSVLAWPTRCPLRSLPALSGTLILSWQGQRGTSLDGKGRNSPQHESGPVQPPSWLVQVLYCELLCCVCERKEVLWKRKYQSLVSGLLSYSYSLPALFVLSSPSCLILPSPSSNHVFPRSFLLFHPLMGLVRSPLEEWGIGQGGKGRQTQEERNFRCCWGPH